MNSFNQELRIIVVQKYKTLSTQLQRLTIVYMLGKWEAADLNRWLSSQILVWLLLLFAGRWLFQCGYSFIYSYQVKREYIAIKYCYNDFLIHFQVGKCIFALGKLVWGFPANTSLRDIPWHDHTQNRYHYTRNVCSKTVRHFELKSTPIVPNMTQIQLILNFRTRISMTESELGCELSSLSIIRLRMYHSIVSTYSNC